MRQLGAAADESNKNYIEQRSQSYQREASQFEIAPVKTFSRWVTHIEKVGSRRVKMYSLVGTVDLFVRHFRFGRCKVLLILLLVKRT